MSDIDNVVADVIPSYRLVADESRAKYGPKKYLKDFHEKLAWRCSVTYNLDKNSESSVTESYDVFSHKTRMGVVLVKQRVNDFEASTYEFLLVKVDGFDNSERVSSTWGCVDRVVLDKKYYNAFAHKRQKACGALKLDENSPKYSEDNGWDDSLNSSKDATAVDGDSLQIVNVHYFVVGVVFERAC